MAAMYLSYMGKSGLRAVAELCYHKAHYAATKIAEVPGYDVVTGGLFFNEFVVQCPKPVVEINEALLKKGFLGGYDLQRDYPHALNQMLVCVTELNTLQQIDRLVGVLETLSE
jgi:glycine dehydrogenase subunit 1